MPTCSQYTHVRVFAGGSQLALAPHSLQQGLALGIGNPGGRAPRGSSLTVWKPDGNPKEPRGFQLPDVIPSGNGTIVTNPERERDGLERVGSRFVGNRIRFCDTKWPPHKKGGRFPCITEVVG